MNLNLQAAEADIEPIVSERTALDLQALIMKGFLIRARGVRGDLRYGTRHQGCLNAIAERLFDYEGFNPDLIPAFLTLVDRGLIDITVSVSTNGLRNADDPTIEGIVRGEIEIVG